MEGQVLSTDTVVGISRERVTGWGLALSQLQRPELAVGMAPGLQQGQGEEGVRRDSSSWH